MQSTRPLRPRREALRVLAAALVAPGAAASAFAEPAAEPTPLAFLGFELIDDHPDPSRDAAHARRLAAITAQLREGLQRERLYRVVDNAPAAAAIADLRARNAFVYRCNACFDGVGRALGVRLVAVGWVQRVSNLILNINVSVREADTDREVLAKSVDLRGDNDESWRRGIDFMLRDWAERRAANPRYGR